MMESALLAGSISMSKEERIEEMEKEVDVEL